MIKVIGDIMLDRWIIGTANRMSPEAPIPVLKENTQSFSIGGAGNLASNLANLHIEISLYGAVSSDKEGYKIIELLKHYNTITNHIQFDHSVTTTKTRLVGQGGQHIVRWDREEKYQGSIDNLNANSQIVIISDYNKGVVTNKLMNDLKNSKVFVDPKQQPELYKDCFLVKPNMSEYVNWFGIFDIKTAQAKLKEYGWKWLVVTDGANGVYAINKDNYWHFKEEVREVADVTGAGDTFLAVLVYGHIIKEMSIPDACNLACYASARNVEKRGVHPVTFADLDKGVVWTNGVFDILHEGHFKLLKFAKSKGQKLIVGINSDASTKRLKGNNRPINNQLQRQMNLKLLPWVDDVIIFDEDTPINAINKVKPNLIVKGGDYTIETIVGHENYPVEIFPTIEGVSTTSIIERIK